MKEEDVVQLGLACTDVCAALDRASLNGRRLDNLNQSALAVISQLTT